MATSNKVIGSIITVLVFVALIFWLTKDLEVVSEDFKPAGKTEEWVTYKTSEYSPQFSYPKAWGEVSINEGNKTCPEEDTYRTQDSLSVFDQEFSWRERTLPGSESMLRSGVRIRELDPKALNECGDAFLHQIATKKLNPAILSSVRLEPRTLSSGLWGFYNDRASRLDTEAREQYTFFMTDSLGRIYAIQVYFSFVPYFGSPELKEIEGSFKNDIMKYVKEGETAGPIREALSDFKKIAESLKWSGE